MKAFRAVPLLLLTAAFAIDVHAQCAASTRVAQPERVLTQKLVCAHKGAPDKPATTLTTCVPDDAGGGDGLALVHRKFPPGTALRLGAPDGPRAIAH